MLYEGERRAYSIFAPFIPVENTDIYRQAIVQDLVTVSDLVFFKNTCMGSVKTYLTCYDAIWENQIIDRNFDQKFVTKHSNKPCIVEVSDNKFYISNFAPTRVTKIDHNAQLSSTLLAQGVHIFERDNNYIISCSNLTFKVFKNKIIVNKMTEHLTSPVQKDESLEFYHKSFGIINTPDTYQYRSHIYVSLLVVVILFCVVTVIYVQFRKNSVVSTETHSLKSIN